MLFSPEIDERLAAARRRLQDARDREPAAAREGRWQPRRIGGSLRQLQPEPRGHQVLSPDKARAPRRHAALAQSSDTEARAMLLQLSNAQDVDPELREAAGKAIAALDSRLATLRLVQTLFQGLSLGSVLLLAAIGLAITFGVMGVINMAHGEMVMLGAYTTFVVQQVLRDLRRALDYSVLIAVPAAFLVAGAARRGARARPDPPPLRPAARDAADDLGPQHDPAAGGALDLRRRPTARWRRRLDDRRDRSGRRHHRHPEPALHHRLRLRRAGRDRRSSRATPASGCRCAP